MSQGKRNKQMVIRDDGDGGETGVSDALMIYGVEVSGLTPGPGKMDRTLTDNDGPETRIMHCPFYDVCLDKAIFLEWTSFTCEPCQVRKCLSLLMQKSKAVRPLGTAPTLAGARD